jgi:uncharacterized membrane protein YgcG
LKTILSAGLFLLFLVLSLYSISDASEAIPDFHSDIAVNADASMTVRETIRVRSEGRGIKHGIYRDFPTRYKDRFGNRYVVGFEVTEVLRNNMQEPYQINDIADGKRIYIGDKEKLIPPGEYTYTIVYTTNRQIGFFEDHDELYWNVTGNEWEFPIEHASATVELPEKAAGRLISSEAYTGGPGSSNRDFETSVDPSGKIVFSTTKPLGAREGLTIVVTWPKGLITEPDAGSKIIYFFSDNSGVIFGLGGLTVLFLYYFIVWSMFGRDPEKGIIVTRYSPPEDMSPAVMRYIAAMGYDDRVFTSAVINMAVKGHINIVEDYGEYSLHKIDDGKLSLSQEEERIQNKLFGPEKELVLESANHARIKAAIDSLKNYLALKYEKIYFLRNAKYFVGGAVLTVITLILTGFWEASDKGRIFIFLFMCVWLSIWSLGVFGLLHQTISKWKTVARGRHGTIANTGGAVFLTLFSIPFVAGEIAGLGFLVYSTSLFMLFFVTVSGAMNYLFYHLLKAPTKAGRNLLDAVEGFRVFLSATEKDRLNMVHPPQKTPELFEKYLPYALALDLEQQWSEEFSDTIFAAASGKRPGYSPVWFSGTSIAAMTASDFAGSMGSSLSDAISSSSAAPGSSSGSGGGGSSGGGGGGGGGGGW